MHDGSPQLASSSDLVVSVEDLGALWQLLHLKRSRWERRANLHNGSQYIKDCVLNLLTTLLLFCDTIHATLNSPTVRYVFCGHMHEPRLYHLSGTGKAGEFVPKRRRAHPAAVAPAVAGGNIAMTPLLPR